MNRCFSVPLLISFLIGCGEGGWRGEAWVENGVQVIENPEQGTWSENRIELIQDLVIGDERNPKKTLYNIKAIEVSSDGRVYILDAGNFRVVVFDKQGQFLFQFGARGAGPGEFNQAWDMALDAAGNVYVLDVSAKRIVKFSPQGRYVDNIQNVSGDAFDLRGNNLLLTQMRLTTFGVFAQVMDLKSARIKFTLELSYTYDPNVTSGGISLGERYQFLRDGKIYLAVPYPYEIRKYSPTGKLEMRILKKDSRVAAPYIKIEGDMRFIMDRGMAGPCFLTRMGLLLNSVYWFVPGEEGRIRKTAIDFFDVQGHFLGSIDLPASQKLVAVDDLDNLYLVQPEPYEKVIRVRMRMTEE